MKRRLSLAVLTALTVAILGGPLQVLAVEDMYSERTMEISRKLSCPICSGQTVADSQSRLAAEMRDTIESQVQSGWSDQEIYDFFVARFGDEVLAEPPRDGFNLALWWIPVVAVALGALVLTLYFRDSRRLKTVNLSAEPDPEHDAELEQIARDALVERPSRLVTEAGPES